MLLLDEKFAKKCFLNIKEEYLCHINVFVTCIYVKTLIYNVEFCMWYYCRVKQRRWILQDIFVHVYVKHWNTLEMYSKKRVIFSGNSCNLYLLCLRPVFVYFVALNVCNFKPLPGWESLGIKFCPNFFFLPLKGLFKNFSNISEYLIGLM